MKGKRALITGATDGIGKQAALEIAGMGAAVTLVGRNEAKTRAVCGELQSQTGNEDIDWLLGDLSSMAEVRRIADEFRNRHERLDVLLNNAGASFSSYAESVDGLEMTIALNHFSYYLLANLLLDILKTTAAGQGEARVVNVSSSAHNAAGSAGLQLDALSDPSQFKAFRAYGGSKLANLLFTYELDRRLAGAGVSVNAVHPGLVNTSFGDNMSGFMRHFFKLMKTVIGRTPQKGAETLVYLATSPEVVGISGKYWADKKQLDSSAISYDREKQRQLWEYSAEASGVG
ncbi:MAG: SDR family oxidoreductase [Chloroflexi bacterium]|nr:SDR family oxidoreductase [Chloroflexota bacterium]